jgi:Double zinc ribbon
MTCPACSAPSTGGRFCSSCGAPLEGALCPACRSQLTTGAKFCHRCGTAVGGSAPPDPRAASTVPWAVASIALIALIALVAGRNFGTHKAPADDEAPQAPQAQAAPDANAPFAGGAAGGAAAPDISSMSPAERADRLYDRVMRYHSEGKDDSAQTFAPMAMAAYQMMDSLTLDQRYDLGRIGEVVGLPDVARAEADTILALDPTHLLGLALAARTATLAKQDVAAGQYYRRLLAALPAERKKNLPEYARHSADIDAAVAEARKQRA